MNSIGRLLKETVQDVAKKQVRTETRRLRKALGQNRKIIANLSSSVRDMERRIAVLLKQVSSSSRSTGEVETGSVRFSAKGLRTQRKRLGLSATEFGALVGATGHAIGKWERGEARPEGKQLVAVAELRQMGKRDVMRRMEGLARKQR